MILIDGVRYHLWTPQNEEKEFHPIIKENHKEIFDQDSVYFDLKPKLSSKAGIAAIPDAYVISLSKPFKWYIVEIELASHPLYEHIVSQLTKFFNGIKNPQSRNEIRDALYSEIRSDKLLRAYIDEKAGSDETYHFLTRLIQEDPEVVIIIDQATENVREACEALAHRPIVLEFETYRRENADTIKAYLFEPLRLGTKEVVRKVTEIKEKKVPEHYTSWEKMLTWVEPQTKELALRTIKDIRDGFRDVVDKPSGKYYRFFKGREGSTTCFAALILTKKKIHVRVRIDPNSFSDPQHWLVDQVYKGWFMPGRGQEREFLLDSNSQLDYAMKLIAQSYALAK